MTLDEAHIKAHIKALDEAYKVQRKTYNEAIKASDEDIKARDEAYKAYKKALYEAINKARNKARDEALRSSK